MSYPIDAALVNPAFSPIDRLQIGEQFTQLYLPQWGLRGSVLAPAENPVQNAYPPQYAKNQTSTIVALPNLPSIQGISIAPNSPIDRVILGFDNGVKNTTQAFAGQGYPEEIVSGNEIMVSVDRPWLARSPADVAVVSTGDIAQPVYIRSDTSANWYTNYFPVGGANGTTVNFAGGSTQYTEPCLIATLWYSPVYVHAKRSPLSQAASVLFNAVGVEQKLMVVPIFGRKTITLNMRPSFQLVNAVSMTLRISVVTQALTGSSAVLPPYVAYSVEQTLVTSGVITADAPAVNSYRTVITDPRASFLIVYGTQTAGLAPSVNADINIVAED